MFNLVSCCLGGLVVSNLFEAQSLEGTKADEER
jgi:hypothetical protein